ncbi:MAG: DUF4129 domain-containing protein, partial [bacterium]
AVTEAPAHSEGFWAGVHRVLPAMRGMMEFCWLFPWIVVIGGGLYGETQPLLTSGWALAMLLGAQLALRPVVDRASTLRLARVTLVGVGLAIGLVAVHQQYYREIPIWTPAWIGILLRATHDAIPAVPQPVAAGFAAACLWWRGLALGGREVGAFDVDQAYKTGVGMVVAYLAAAAIYPDAQGFLAGGPDLPVLFVAFFFIGLTALALARLATIWDRGRAQERAQVPGRAWLLLVVGVVGLILFGASAMAGLAAADVPSYLVLPLRPLLPLLELVFLVMFFIAGIIVRVLIAILSRIPRRDVPETQPPPTFFDDLLRRLREIEMNPQVVEGARWGMVAALLALLLLGMALAIVFVRRRERKKDDDEHESVWSTRAWLAGLGDLLPRFGGGAGAGEERPAPEVRAIRRVYLELLRLGARLGAPRTGWATPREHEPRLQDVLSQAVPELEALRWAYERVRYGTWRPRATEVQDAEATLERVKMTVEQPKI